MNPCNWILAVVAAAGIVLTSGYAAGVALPAVLPAAAAVIDEDTVVLTAVTGPRHQLILIDPQPTTEPADEADPYEPWHTRDLTAAYLLPYHGRHHRAESAA
jgi:hypothetical protein